MTETVKGYGLTSAHAIYLIVLYLEGRKTQKELTEFLDMDPANTFRVIKTLEDKGFIYDDRKTPSSRNYNLYLTEIGKKVSKETMDSTTKWMDGLMSDIPDSDMVTLKNTLVHILLKIEPNLWSYVYDEHTNQFYTYLGLIVKDTSYESPLRTKNNER